MITFFPELYKDELFYSWISRYYQRSGYPAYTYVQITLKRNASSATAERLFHF